MGFCYNIFGSTARQVIPFRKSRGKKRDQINKEKKGNRESLHWNTIAEAAMKDSEKSLFAKENALCNSSSQMCLVKNFHMSISACKLLFWTATQGFCVTSW